MKYKHINGWVDNIKIILKMRCHKVALIAKSKVGLMAK